MSRLKLMILCGRSARHLHVANALCQACEALAIVQETGGEWNLNKTLKKLRPDNLFRKAWRWLRDRRRYTGNPETKFFFPHGEPLLDHPELVREVPHINHPDVVKLACELKPDLICVFGTSLIRGDLLNEGRLGIVNLHGGLSPEYRGADCTFWALYNGEPEKVGRTLHYIDAGIDTGRLTNFTSQPGSLGGLFLCQASQCFELPAVDVAPGATARVAVGKGTGLDGVVATQATIGELKPSDGEIALYTSNKVDDPKAKLLYLQWGSTPHQNTEVAIDAGLWVEGAYAPTAPDATRLYRQDTGLWLFDTQ